MEDSTTAAMRELVLLDTGLSRASTTDGALLSSLQLSLLPDDDYAQSLALDPSGDLFLGNSDCGNGQLHVRRLSPAGDEHWVATRSNEVYPIGLRTTSRGSLVLVASRGITNIAHVPRYPGNTSSSFDARTAASHAPHPKVDVRCGDIGSGVGLLPSAPEAMLDRSFLDAVTPIVARTNQEVASRYGELPLERYLEFTRVLLGSRAARIDDPRQRNGRTSMLWFPGLEAKPWHDTSAQWIRDLERAAPAIRDELKRVLGSPESFVAYEPTLGQGALEFESREWQAFYLHRVGRPFPGNHERCPRTIEALRHAPLASEAMFTVLRGGGYVDPHCSDFNAKLTCHLGLLVPDGAAIRVGGETRTWTEGRCLLFDDTYEHEVWNHSDTLRAILLLDVWHPGLTEVERAALELLMNRMAEAGVLCPPR